jgi:Tol biopolymer transport system component
MNGYDDFDRTLSDWFEHDALSPAPAAGLDRVLDATGRHRPRPAWLAGPGSRWVGATPSSGVRSLQPLGLRWSTAFILLLAILALVGGAILAGARLVQPTPLPNGGLGHLAYGLDGDIYLADWDGSNAVRIADGVSGSGSAGCNSYWGEGPMWSPDGRHFAYRSSWDDRCGGTVVITDPATKGVASIVGSGWLVSWSPDSTRIATWTPPDQSIGIFGFDGVRQALLTMPTGCALPGDFDPVWSPDGQSVVVWPCEVPLDGSKPHGLPTTDPRSHAQWAYSPDGARVVYVDGESLVVDSADGSDRRVLVETGVAAGGLAVIWSPSGDRIAFDAGSTLSAPDEIRLVDPATGTVAMLARASGTDALHVIRFSPSGDRILFARMDANWTGTSLWSVDADGSNERLLVNGTGWGDWQPLAAGS